MTNLIIENEAQKIADYINANYSNRARDITTNDFYFDDSPTALERLTAWRSLKPLQLESIC